MSKVSEIPFEWQGQVYTLEIEEGMHEVQGWIRTSSKRVGVIYTISDEIASDLWTQNHELARNRIIEILQDDIRSGRFIG